MRPGPRLGIEWFVAKPLKMMPYLDSSYVFGNTCAEPNAWIREDMISTGRRRSCPVQIRHHLFRPVRLQLHGTDGRRPERETDFPSYNGSLLTNITIFRNNSTGSGLYLASEFDFGNGFDFNEGARAPPPRWSPSRIPPVPSRGRTPTSAT